MPLIRVCGPTEGPMRKLSLAAVAAMLALTCGSAGAQWRVGFYFGGPAWWGAPYPAYYPYAYPRYPYPAYYPYPYPVYAPPPIYYQRPPQVAAYSRPAPRRE